MSEEAEAGNAGAFKMTDQYASAVSISRRRVAAAIVGCCGMCASKQAASQLPRTFMPTAPQGIIACGSEPSKTGEFKPIPARVRSQSGNQLVDNGLPIERRQLDYVFGLSGVDGTKDFGRPSFHFYEDSDMKIGARAVRGANTGCSIYLGLNLIADEVSDHGSHWGTVIAGILAHEWGHAFQYRSDLDERLFVWETHADYLAGWYLGVKKVFGIPVEPELFSKALFARGNKLGYFNENDYGFPQQRVDAMTEGLKFGLSHTIPNQRPSVDDAATAGYEIVYRMRQKSQVR